MQSKVVIITGANGGLGRAVTEAFLATEATVVGTSRKIKQQEFEGDRFRAIAADLTQTSSAKELVRQVVDSFGRIDVLVHVMGGFAAGKLHETDDATWGQMRDLNLTSAFNILREAIPVMRRQEYGRIVVVGSLAAAEAHAGLAAYVIFKSAVLTLTRTVALENKDAGITANAVLPDTMDTAANRQAMPGADFSLWAKTSDVAKAILLLAGDDAGQVNGAVVPVYGRGA